MIENEDEAESPLFNLLWTVAHEHGIQTSDAKPEGVVLNEIAKLQIEALKKSPYFKVELTAAGLDRASKGDTFGQPEDDEGLTSLDGLPEAFKDRLERHDVNPPSTD